MTLMRAIAIGALAVVMVAGRADAQSAETAASVLLLQQWIAAVEQHVPGKLDSWVRTMAQLKYADRSRLHPVMTAFLKAVAPSTRHEGAALQGSAPRRVLKLAHAVALNPGPALFLRRAAILHADVGIFTGNSGGFEDPTLPPVRALPGGPRAMRRATVADSPLLSNERFILSRDGQVIGEAAADWNWLFARSLIDQLLVVDTAGAPAFAADWYHATTAYMLRTGLYPDALAHLDHALAILPGESRLLFDRGCYAESLGLPKFQILRDESRSAQRVDIPPGHATNADAEKWFLRALEADPAFAEARVRLARLQDLDGRHEEALAGIERALTSKPRGEAAYYAHLFGGRAAQALGRLAEARRHYTEASQVFPEAQSALLAGSQAALLAGDVTAALALTQQLGERTASVTADPWWSYLFGAGRDLNGLFAPLWAQARH